MKGTYFWLAFSFCSLAETSMLSFMGRQYKSIMLKIKAPFIVHSMCVAVSHSVQIPFLHPLLHCSTATNTVDKASLILCCIVGELEFLIFCLYNNYYIAVLQLEVQCVVLT